MSETITGLPSPLVTGGSVGDLSSQSQTIAGGTIDAGYVFDDEAAGTISTVGLATTIASDGSLFDINYAVSEQGIAAMLIIADAVSLSAAGGIGIGASVSGSGVGTLIGIGSTQSLSLAAHQAAGTIEIETIGLSHAEITGLQAGDTLTLLDPISALDPSLISDGTLGLASAATILIDGIAFSQIEDNKGNISNWTSGTQTVDGRAFRSQSVVIGAFSPYADITDSVNAQATAAAKAALLQSQRDQAGSSHPGGVTIAVPMTEIIAPLSLPRASDPVPHGAYVLSNDEYLVSLGNGSAMQVSTTGATIFPGSGALPVDYTPGAYANMIVGGPPGLDVEAGTAAGMTTIAGSSGGLTVHGGVAGDGKLIIAGPGALSYIGGAGNDTIFAGNAPSVSINGGSGHFLFIGGPSMVSVSIGQGDEGFLSTGGGRLTGSASGAVLAGGAGSTLVGGGGDLLVSSGNGAVLDGSASSSNTFFALSGGMIKLGGGSDLAVAASGTVQAGGGNTAIYIGAGGGETIEVGPSANAARALVVDGFQQGSDHLELTGGVSATRVVDWGGGASTVVLSDGSSVNLFGVDASNLQSLA